MASELLPGYEYDKLDDDKLRLLVLDPGPQDAPLNCRMDTVEGVHLTKPEEQVSYEALSWCWPSPNEQRELRVLNVDKGKTVVPFLIPLQLHEALVNLRYNSGKKRWLWIDYICINQHDIEERNHQVARMSDIYGHACNVCVWLGPHRFSSDLAFQLVDEVRNNPLQFERFLEQDHMAKFKALRDLMNREWFIRRWVVQEIALARAATIHCGSSSQNRTEEPEAAPGLVMQWQDFAAVVSLLNDNESVMNELSRLAHGDAQLEHNARAFDDIQAWPASTLISTTTQLKKMAGGGPQKTITLTDLVSSLAMFKTSEPRDTIYALLALAKDSEPSNISSINRRVEKLDVSRRSQQTIAAMSTELSSSRHQHYPVDYKQSVLAVYQQFMQFSIQQTDATRALDVICRPFAQKFTKADDARYNKDELAILSDPKTEVDLPSWMPSSKKNAYTQPGITPNTTHYSSFSNTDSTQMTERQYGDPFVSMPDVFVSYQAAGSVTCNKRKIRFRQRKDHYSMYVEGFVLDVVKSPLFPASQFGSIPPHWIDCLKNKGKRDADPDVLWRTLVANRSSTRNAPYFFKMVLEKLLSPDGQSERGYNTNDRLSRTTSSSETRVLKQLLATLTGRSLIVTPHSSQDLIGLGPGETREGDLICILYGCTVPVILRQIAKSPEQMKLAAEEDEKDLAKRIQSLLKMTNFMMKLKAALERARARRSARSTGRHVLPVVRSEHVSTRTVSTELTTSPVKPLTGEQANADAVSPVAERRSETAYTAFSGADPSTGSILTRLNIEVLDSSLHAAGITIICAVILEYWLGYPMLLIVFASLVIPPLFRALTYLIRRALGQQEKILTASAESLVTATALLLLSLLTIVSSQTAIESTLKFLVSTLLSLTLGYPGLLPTSSSTAEQIMPHTDPRTRGGASLPLSAAKPTAQTDTTPSASIEIPAGNAHNMSTVIRVPDEPRPVGNSTENGAKPRPASRVDAPYATLTIEKIRNTMRQKQKTRAQQEAEDEKYYYEVIGECYIDKMMNGEAIERLNRRGDYIKPDDTDRKLFLRNMILELR